MGLRLGTAVIAPLLVICGAVARTDSAKANYSVYGVWRGQMDGLPAITLVVTDEPGSLTGAIQFYFLQRKTEKNPWTAEPRAPEPIFNVTYGETLLFEVSHRRAHPPQSLNDPPKHYRFKLNGPNTAEGVNLDESGPALKLVRSDYLSDPQG